MTRFGSHRLTGVGVLALAACVGWGSACGAAENRERDAGVGESACAAELPVTCDGTNELRLLVSIMSRADRVGDGDRVLFENGAYVLLDGRCHYWVKSAEDYWVEVKTGILEPAELGSLLNDLHHGCWPDLEAVYPRAEGVYDTPDIVFMDTANWILCQGLCGLGGDEVLEVEPVASMRDAVAPWNRRLWGSGAAVGGDVRLQVIEAPMRTADRYPPSTWPATTVALSDIAVPEGESWRIDYGDGVLFTGAEADAFRELRRQYMAGEHGIWHYRFIPIVDDAGALYELYLRDTSPFENERGLLEWLHGAE